MAKGFNSPRSTRGGGNMMLLTAINKALDSARALSEEKMAPFTSMLGGMGLG